MAKVTYSGVRESKPNRVNDLGTTGQEVSENFKKGCLKRADRSFAQGLQCQQINSLAALMSLEDAVFISFPFSARMCGMRDHGDRYVPRRTDPQRN